MQDLFLWISKESKDHFFLKMLLVLLRNCDFCYLKTFNSCIFNNSISDEIKCGTMFTKLLV